MSSLVYLLSSRSNHAAFYRLNNVSRCGLLISRSIKNHKRTGIQFTLNHQHCFSTKFNNILTNRKNQCTKRSLLELNDGLVICSRSIRTTDPNRLPPIFWLVLRPALNAIALLGGRKARRWWQTLSEEQKQYYRQKLKRNQRLVYSLAAGLLFCSTLFYFTHLQETPITKRKRFMALDKSKFNELTDIQFEIQLKMFENKLLPTWHKYSKQVERVATRIIRANLDIPEFREKNWTTAVIDAPHIKNAMVVGDGRIFVFTGMLNMCENDDALGFVLAHEIAHSILSHGIEILSYSSLLEIFLAIGIFFLWSVMPSDLYALIASYLTKKITDILFSLPWNREMEIEADKVGMMFHAKSCYDVREGVAFWLKMGHHERTMKQIGFGSKDDKEVDNIVEFLSTHPAHDRRAEYLEAMLEETLELRDKCGCPRLPYRDPIKLVQRKIEEQKRTPPQNYVLIRIE